MAPSWTVAVAGFVTQKVRVGRRRLQPTVRLGSSVSHSRAKGLSDHTQHKHKPARRVDPGGLLCFSYIEARLLSRTWRRPWLAPQRRASPYINIIPQNGLKVKLRCRNRFIVLRRKGLAGVSKIGLHSG
jgi:hypothetical protein